MKKSSRVRTWFTALAALATLAVVGAGTWESATPRMRFGSLPFPGRFTLYTPVGVADLGVHRHGPWARRVGETDETGTGILYTRRAGFLDLAHMREYVDWGKYVHDRASESLAGGVSSFDFEWSGGTFRVTVSRPRELAAMSAPERSRAIREMSRLFAQRMVVVMGTWHEAATWHGERTFPGISETRSAFTWDDTSSHVVASWVVGRALLRPLADWDDAVTLELAAQLQELEAVDSETGAQAVQAIRGLWWTDDDGGEPRPLRRDLDTGLYTGVKHAWLVPGMSNSANDSHSQAALPLPAWPTAPDGTDLSAVFTVRVTGPAELLSGIMGDDPALTPRTSMDPERDLAQAIEVIRRALHGDALAASPN